MLLRGQRRVLILLQNFRQALPARKLPLGNLIKLIGAELRKGRKLAVLRHIQTQRTGHLAHRLNLCVAAHAAHADAHVNRRTDAGVEEIRFQINLSVSNRNYVRRDVRRDVSGLGLDHGQCCERACTQFIVQLRSPFQQAGVQIKHVAGKRFAPGRAAQ